MAELAAELRHRTKLRYPLYETNGILLLAAGSEITPSLRSLLDRRGIHLEFMCTLEILEGNPLGLKIPMKQDIVTVGRNPDCQIRPDSEIVSGRHCRIHKRAFGVIVTDCNSTNGTFVNDGRITAEVELSDGDRLRIGNVVFKVLLDAAVAADSDDDQKAIEEFLVAEPFSTDAPSEPVLGPTIPISQLPKMLDRKRHLTNNA